MPSEDTYLFIALWEQEIKIIECYPLPINLDLELTSMQIFIAFQNYYTNETKEKGFKRSFFKLPIKNINKIASIFLDVIKEKEKEIPFISAILFPGYYNEKDIEVFDDLLNNLGSEYKEFKKVKIEKSYSKIKEILELKEKVRDAEIKIEKSYSKNDALIDFKKGMELFSNKKYDQSYFFLKKAHLKFKNDNDLKMLLDSSFFIGSALSQLNKLNIAQEYFKLLEDLSIKLQNSKYYEMSIYMSGFCAFKTEHYDLALTQFKKLESKNIQHINKFQFYFLYGRVLRLLNQNEKSIAFLSKAKDVSFQTEDDQNLSEKRAKLYLELGHTNYNIAIDLVKSGKFDKNKIGSYLKNAINYYEESIQIWKEDDNYFALIDAYRLIGNIYNVVNEFALAIDYYRKAMEYAELTNDILNRLKTFSLIVQIYVKLNMHEVIVKEMDEMLSKIVSFAFVDLFTIAGFHRQLGDSLFRLNNNKEALSELLIALNIYNKFDTPRREALSPLKIIIEIYRSNNEEKYVQYYQEQFNNLENKIKQFEAKSGKLHGFLANIKEFWLVMDDGTTIFSYAPETSFDPHLFGSFISALQTFSLELTSESLNAISMGLDQYTFYREKGKSIFVLGRASVKSSLNQIRDALSNIFNEFWKQYNQFFENFDGNVGRFSNFANWIENAKKLEWKKE